MNQKIAELTSKLFDEGVQKGQQKAAEIIAGAEGCAQQVITDAKAQAETILANAAKEAEELKQKISNEIKLSSEQAFCAVKQRITEALMNCLVDKPVSEMLLSADTLKEFITILLQNWKVASVPSPSLTLLLPAVKQVEIEKALTGALQSNMAKGLTIQFSKTIKAGFQIQPQGTAYKISFTNEDFIEFFREFLRPKTDAFLFGKK